MEKSTHQHKDGSSLEKTTREWVSARTYDPVGTMQAYLQVGSQGMLGILHDKPYVLCHGKLRWNFHAAVEHVRECIKLRILSHAKRVVAVGDPDNEAILEMGLRVH